MKLTSLCYLERDGQYLMLHRTKKENDIHRDKWLGVGGKFERDESPEDCMRREIYEETGFTASAWCFRGIVTFVSDSAETEYMHLFTVTDWTGEQQLCDEGELAWIEKSRLRELTLWEGDRIFLKLLEDDAPFFSLKLTYEGDRLTEAVLNGKKL